MCLTHKYSTPPTKEKPHLNGEVLIQDVLNEDVLYCNIASASTKTPCEKWVIHVHCKDLMELSVSAEKAEKTAYVKLTAELEQALSKYLAEEEEKKKNKKAKQKSEVKESMGEGFPMIVDGSYGRTL
jgi:uncharacterized protein YabN with tetrapyrrole methylase and pyrophosphatase domain